MGTSRITMQQIADRLGVSKYTVSQALSGKPGVSESTRRQVLQTAKSMGYRLSPRQPAPDGAGEPAAGGEAFALVWIPRREREEPSFWQRVLSGISSACEDRGWKTVILTPSASDRGEAAVLPSYVDAARCVGGLAIGSFPLPTVAAMTGTGLPIVLVDHDEPFAAVDSVVNNNVEAAHGLIARMADTGCRRLLFIGADRFSVSFRERWWGCRMAAEELAARGAALALRRWQVPYGDPAWPARLQEKLEALPEDDWPDGFVCANDNIALELIGALRQRGVRVPEISRVAGFDNIQASARSLPALTTVDLGKEELGRRAVEALERRIAEPDRPHERIALSARLVIRSSC